MKNGIVHILIVTLFLVASCGKVVYISESELDTDLFFLESSSKPYTGTCIVNYTGTKLVKHKMEFKDGYLEGESTSFFRSGNMKWRGTYSKGLLNGNWEYWDEEGNKTCEMNYINDTVEGNFIGWHTNGKIMETGTFISNHKTGTWKEYDMTGKLIAKKEY